MTIELNAFLAQRNISIVFLPTYSPVSTHHKHCVCFWIRFDEALSGICAQELNPCELVFGYVKNNLRRTRDSSRSFHNEVYDRFLEITPRMLETMYHHCLKE